MVTRSMMDIRDHHRQSDMINLWVEGPCFRMEATSIKLCLDKLKISSYQFKVNHK